MSDHYGQSPGSDHQNYWIRVDESIIVGFKCQSCSLSRDWYDRETIFIAGLDTMVQAVDFCQV